MSQKKLVVVLAVVAAVLVAAFALYRRTRPREVAVATTTGAPEGEILAWCADGLVPVRGEGCLSAPSPSPSPTDVPLVVYAHGRFPGDHPEQELPRQARVARIANARGYALLAVRGKRGECTDPTIADFVCWPSNEKNADDGAAFAAKVAVAIKAAREKIGAGPTFLLGFSSGAYFAALSATRALYPFDAIVIAHGGPVQPTKAIGARTPLLLITADDDPSNDEMMRLDEELARERWPRTFITREGGHELPEWDIEKSLAFFGRYKDKMPLDPPLATRVPRRTPPDAGAPSDATSAPAAPSVAEDTTPATTEEAPTETP